jgi:hypothetical protein
VEVSFGEVVQHMATFEDGSSLSQEGYPGDNLMRHGPLFLQIEAPIDDAGDDVLPRAGTGRGGRQLRPRAALGGETVGDRDPLRRRVRRPSRPRSGPPRRTG